MTGFLTADRAESIALIPFPISYGFVPRLKLTAGTTILPGAFLAKSTSDFKSSVGTSNRPSGCPDSNDSVASKAVAKSRYIGKAEATAKEVAPLKKSRLSWAQETRVGRVPASLFSNSAKG